jgi:predicted dienelactone hydrolase
MNLNLLHRRTVLTTLGATLLSTLGLAQTGMAQLKAGELPITLVYPTAAANTTVSRGPFTLQAAVGAAPLRGNGRLVVLSHGTGGSATSEFDLASTLAAAGFVVAQPEHAGDNWRDYKLAGPESWKLRPVEVSQTIDAVAQDPRFGPLLDTTKVGVHGLSAGGVSALALAGGQWSLASLVNHCIAQQKTDANFCFNGLPHQADRDARAALFAKAAEQDVDATLQGGAKVHDPRVAAVALTVPVVAPFTTESLSKLRVPVGVVEATRDTVLLPAHHSSRLLQLCKACKALGAMEGAEHFDMLSPWPDAVDQPVRAVQGGQVTGFDRGRLPASYGRVATFFQQTLLP